MIIDSHQHYWNKALFNYPWLTPESGCLYRAFEPRDLIPLARENNVVKTVVVQAMSSCEETAWLLKLADQNELIGGVVGWVDLKSGNVAEKLAEFARNPKFKSVRHQIEDEPNREWILQSEVLTSLKAAEKAGIAFDVLMKHDQLWQVREVREKCPDLRMVIDHAAKPDIKHGEFAPWASHLKTAAQYVDMCKLSGLFTEADHATWEKEDIRRYFDFVLETFGTDRVMFGSDWPVSTMASNYSRTVHTSLELCAELSETERQKVFFENAKSFYKIDV